MRVLTNGLATRVDFETPDFNKEVQLVYDAIDKVIPESRKHLELSYGIGYEQGIKCLDVHIKPKTATGDVIKAEFTKIVLMEIGPNGKIERC